MKKYGRLNKNIFNKILRDIKQEGLLFLIKKVYRFFQFRILKIFSNQIVTRLKKRKIEFFYFQEKKLEYLIHKYNITWINERTIEVPIVLDWIKDSKSKSILEVGSVLQNYVNSVPYSRYILSFS